MTTRLGALLTDHAELLLRHATDPGWIVDGRPSSQLFELRTIDKGFLSVERGSIAGGAAEALQHFNAAFKSTSSVSVWGVNVGEVKGVGLNSRAQPSKKLPAHAVIDQSAQSPDAQSDSAVKLTRHAVVRGKLA